MNVVESYCDPLCAPVTIPVSSESDAAQIMQQLINLFLVIFGVIGIGISLATWRDAPVVALLSLASGVAMVVLAYVSDRRREQRRDARKRAVIQRSVAEMSRRSWGAGESLQVRAGARPILAAVLVTVTGAGLLYVGLTETKLDAMPFIGIVALPLGLLLLARAVPGIGHPALELTALGFATPLSGRIAWCHVSGICLHTITGRGGAESYWIRFRVNSFARAAPRIHWTDRLFAAFHQGALAKGVVSVALPNAEHHPQAIYTAARQLWTEATGRNDTWNPLLPEAYNKALGRLGEISERMSGQTLRDPREMALDQELFDRDMQFLQREQKRLLNRHRYGIAIMLMAMALLLVWPWIRAWLRF
ncbi:hypothetical protein CS053_03995 [Rhodanobacter glycinis]|uniref:Uncharacterized protein n=1 Tax=Rhodanobacter glycinis TaxID=582702 RepID=A0A5B9E0M3_9GAMM|nr:hypothetical protein [Rhodanobacter glycinis]QEE23767.1 hypothetical protein CS053_03995 [Rhodanobacter glycinis]